MSSEYLRGHILSEPLPTAGSQQLAAIQALLVELVHETKTTNELLRTQTEIDRKTALKVEGISMQAHVMAVQLGRLVEPIDKLRASRGGA